MDGIFTMVDIDRVALSEMGIHIPICSHKNPKNILILTEDRGGFEDEVNRYFDIESKFIQNLDELKSLEDKSFDTILLNKRVDKVSIAHSFRLLRDDGILVTELKSFVEDRDDMLSELKVLSEFFKIVMPFRVENLKKPLTYMNLASKLYHPTADIILQRAELIENLSYYSANLHMASFEIPKFIYSEIQDISKR